MPRSVWASRYDDETTKVLLWRDGEFHWGHVALGDPAEIETRVESSAEPGKQLADSFRFVPNQIVRVKAYERGELNLVVQAGENIRNLTGFFGPGAMQIFELIRRLHPEWTSFSEQEGRVIAAGKALFAGVGAGALVGLIYFLIDRGLINRAHWLIAFVVNTMGTFPLLLFAIFCGVVGLVASALILAKPSIVWTLRES